VKSTKSTHNQSTRREFLRRAGLAALGLSVMPVIQACGGDGGGSAADQAAGAADAAGATVEVEMNDQLEFVPDDLTINAGDTVTWRNVGTIPHTATADPDKAQEKDHVQLPAGAEAWDSGIVNGGESWSYTFETPGQYTYFCIPHELAGMVATITVTE
jgi:plastocyanin